MEECHFELQAFSLQLYYKQHSSMCVFHVFKIVQSYQIAQRIICRSQSIDLAILIKRPICFDRKGTQLSD